VPEYEIDDGGSTVGRTLLIVAFIIGIALTLPPPAEAATLLVDDDAVQCPRAQWRSIQAAVVAAGVSDTIEVCPGTYAEQVIIDSDKSGLTLRATMPRAATIRAPDAPANFGALPIVLVNGARNVTIDGFAIQGLLSIVLCSPTVLAGVMVERGGGVTVRRSVINAIHPVDRSLDWCFRGYGVYAVATTLEPATSVIVSETRIDTYLTGGAFAAGAGADATLERNEIVGDGITADGAQVGVEIRTGAIAALVDNDIRLNAIRAQSIETAPDAARATGVSLVQTRNVRVERNRVSMNDYGITLIDATNTTVRGNQVTDSAAAGIVAFAGSRSNTFEGNSVRSTGSALPSGATTAGVTPDIFPGASDTSSGASRPRAINPIDCIDFSTGAASAGSANQWRGNTGLTAIPAGLCGSG
jgi:parallel beta-helix repeat protein